MSTARETTPASLDELRAEALAAGRAPRRRGTWYVAEHMLRAMRAYGWTIVVGSLGQPVVYLFGLGLGLAAVIDQPIPLSDGREVPYLVFVGPALLMTAAISVATEEFTYPVMSGFKWRRYFFGFSASPISSGQIANGVAIAALARATFTVAVYFVVLVLFGAVPDLGLGWLCIPIGVLAGAAFGMPLMAYAASIQDDKGQFALVQRFVFMPMFLFSGTFYPLDVLPVWLQWIGWVSPLWHASELGRMATTAGTVAWPMAGVHVAYLILLSLAGLLLARRAFTKRLAT